MKHDVFNFSGKVALVTGGSRGIGRATAELFAQSGAKVVIGDIDPAGSETVDEIRRSGGEAIFVNTDVSDESDVRNLIGAAVKSYGGLHCAFNNAGVLPPTVMLAELDETTFDKVIAVDLKGIFLSMKYEIGQMLQAGGGAIVNNASIAGMIAEAGISAYAAAKHGVIGLSKAAALEYASKGIRINALAPGLVETAMTKPWFDDSAMRSYFMANSPIGRFAQPEEIAGMVLFLCSDFASFAAGQTFAIDGGYTAR
ncbi:MAG TPA: glucose 1-dehydrogenase [Candidatus Udaeobacter sp.]|jgi:NAD(P)-dependent dehydrogenase (short-subunit alcohol dehydrogenase family)|nr:glucose 1-dehydrogenase [Candidatus Udaeobacter sp.]